MQAALSHVQCHPRPRRLASCTRSRRRPRARSCRIRVLHTPEERQEIAHLRQHADFRSEYELDPGLASLRDGQGQRWAS